MDLCLNGVYMAGIKAKPSQQLCCGLAAAAMGM